MAFMAVILGLGLLFYILLGFRYMYIYIYIYIFLHVYLGCGGLNIRWKGLGGCPSRSSVLLKPQQEGENPKQSLGTYAWVCFVPNAAASSQFRDTALRSSSDTCCKGIFSDDGLGLFELYTLRVQGPK